LLCLSAFVVTVFFFKTEKADFPPRHKDTKQNGSYPWRLLTKASGSMLTKETFMHGLLASAKTER